LLPTAVNTDGDEFYPSISSKGVLYFTSVKLVDGKKDNIYRCNLNVEPIIVEKLPISINTDGYEFNSYVAPDESYLLFSRYGTADGIGSGDLYISFKKPDGSWTESKNLGDTINSKQMDYCPFVQGNTLYLTSKRDKSSNHSQNNLEQLLFDNNQYNNGQSRIFKVDVKSVLLK